MSFSLELSQASRGLRREPERKHGASAVVQALSEMLTEMHGWISEFPPLEQPMRFGNKAYKQWHNRLVNRSESLILEVLKKGPSSRGVSQEDFAFELSYYLRASFGDEKRIDYGTGHEATFLALLFALSFRGVLAKHDAADIVLVVFGDYMKLMRRLQSVYVLEPAGSHGVWGLDDFHALPFLFGSAQLFDLEEEIATADVASPEMLARHADSFLYLDAIKQILLAKQGAPFHETSPMLFDITAVPTWEKIHAGLGRMYRAEVLGKFPVIQHFLFGRSIEWPGDDGSAHGS